MSALPQADPRARTWPQQGCPRIEGLLFDLDGTLLHTAPDIARALNAALAESGLAALPADHVARLIGRGAPMLVQRAYAALGVAGDRTAAQAATLERFFAHYDELASAPVEGAPPSASRTVAFDGVVEGLRGLSALGLRMGVVTNKQHRFAVALLQRLGLYAHFRVVVGGDTCKQRKPDPEPLLYGCSKLGLSPAHVLMVGDSVNDVQAARAAAMPVICVPYGYNEGQDPRELPCDHLIASIAELPALLEAAAAKPRS